jgi:hypothetical protein
MVLLGKNSLTSCFTISYRINQLQEYFTIVILAVSHTFPKIRFSFQESRITYGSTSFHNVLIRKAGAAIRFQKYFIFHRFAHHNYSEKRMAVLISTKLFEKSVQP